MSVRILGIAALFAVSCMPARYREELPPGTRDSTGRAGAAGAAPRDVAGASVEDRDASGATVVGRVTPDGTLIADTLSGPVPDTTRVERETVVTGEVRPAAALETAPPTVAAPEGEALATGWRVQIFASRSQAEATAAATRVRDALGDRVPVYVERDDPWFKVRAGDFAERAGAEGLRVELAGLGWPDAWAVRSTIRTLP
ncbi:MAG TPA: SPOR domain-containing protein [Gemmatimonadota bacterium]|nr:SPOR domain-containing protein [Gemmatimonadota bacterium]